MNKYLFRQIAFMAIGVISGQLLFAPLAGFPWLYLNWLGTAGAIALFTLIFTEGAKTKPAVTSKPKNKPSEPDAPAAITLGR